MSRLDTSPINASAALIREQGFATSYFKRFLDILWERTGGYHDISDVVETMASAEFVVAAAEATLPNERVGTSTSRIAWDFATAGQAKVDLVLESVTYAYIQNVSATDKILGRSSVGAGSIEEIDCTPFARTLLDDVDAATALATLGAMPATTTLDAIPTPVASVEFDQQQALQFVIENRTSDPVSPVPGQLWLRTDL